MAYSSQLTADIVNEGETALKQASSHGTAEAHIPNSREEIMFVCTFYKKLAKEQIVFGT